MQQLQYLATISISIHANTISATTDSEFANGVNVGMRPGAGSSGVATAQIRQEKKRKIGLLGGYG